MMCCGGTPFSASWAIFPRVLRPRRKREPRRKTGGSIYQPAIRKAPDITPSRTYEALEIAVRQAIGSDMPSYVELRVTASSRLEFGLLHLGAVETARRGAERGLTGKSPAASHGENGGHDGDCFEGKKREQLRFRLWGEEGRKRGERIGAKWEKSDDDDVHHPHQVTSRWLLRRQAWCGLVMALCGRSAESDSHWVWMHMIYVRVDARPDRVRSVLQP